MIVEMRNTTVFEKILPSLLNTLLILTVSSPLLYLFGPNLEWKFSCIAAFYILQVLDTHERLSFRCFGMRVFGTVWARKYGRLQRNFYSILYTLSFSTLFFFVFFPFDLFLVNMLCLQLPAILITGTTLHGCLAGGMRTAVPAKAGAPRRRRIQRRKAA